MKCIIEEIIEKIEKKKINLDDIEKLCEEATAGPWTLGEEGEVIGPNGYCEGSIELAREEDAKFIAESRELIPKLCWKVRYLEDLLDMLADNDELLRIWRKKQE